MLILGILIYLKIQQKIKIQDWIWYKMALRTYSKNIERLNGFRTHKSQITFALFTKQKKITESHFMSN